MNWRIFAASSIGKHHIDIGLPCQDAFAFRQVGDVIIAVVCDGAGSASHSEQGAFEFSHDVVSRLAVSINDLNISDAMSEDAVTSVLIQSRQNLVEIAAQRQYALSDLACTMLGAIVTPERGLIFHIGDGIGLFETEISEPLVSLPENGEYANETYFVTTDAWKEHLRFLDVPAHVTCFALMSDGAMPFAMNHTHKTLSAPFIEPVKRYLASVSEDEGSAALKATLADERTWSITGDDKTLLLAFSKTT